MRHQYLLDYYFQLQFFCKMNALPSLNVHTYLDDKEEVFAMVLTFF